MRTILDKDTARRHLQQAFRKQAAVLKQLNIPFLRQGQEAAIMNLYTHRDTLCFIPTGWGKSMIYIVPTLVHGWRTLILSPLISLMKDQYETLQDYNLKVGLINSAQEMVENMHTLRAWEAGELQFLFVAPERLEMEEFKTLMRQYPPNMVAIDECHCASQWAFTFRPSYARIGDFIDLVKPHVVLGLTATATEEVEEDIRRLFHMENAARVVYYPARDNLTYHCRQYNGGYGLVNAVKEIEGSTIVYCATRANCEEAAEMLKGRFPDKKIEVYHAGLDTPERDIIQNRFMSSELDVVVATNAFGMGIDLPTIRGVIHRDIPGSVEAIAQETGRAGRDGLPSTCYLLRDPESLRKQQFFLMMEFPEPYLIQRVFHYLRERGGEGAELRITLKQMAEQLGERYPQAVESAVKFLTSQRILARSGDTEEPARVKLLKIHPDDELADFHHTVTNAGVWCSDGFCEILPVALMQGMRVSKGKLAKMIERLEKDKYIIYQKPYRGSRTKVIGTMAQADFKRYDLRKRRATARMYEALEFCDCPDEEKPEYLAKFFGRISSNQDLPTEFPDLPTD